MENATHRFSVSEQEETKKQKGQILGRWVLWWMLLWGKERKGKQSKGGRYHPTNVTSGVEDFVILQAVHNILDKADALQILEKGNSHFVQQQ